MLLLSLATAMQSPDGAELFARHWLPDDPRSAGDGLGPLFNEPSCASCHNQGGLGGSGGRIHDVLLENGETVFKNGRSPSAMAARRLTTRIRPATTRRNTPALFGMGDLDEVPEADIRIGAILTDPRFPEVQGRVAETSNGLGRFGWKAQSPSLEHFVELACSGELGLQTPNVDQPGTPGPSPDIDSADLSALSSFVAQLPTPIEIPMPTAEQGRQVFDDVGCTACHTPEIGAVEGAYTDLLLHDLGWELSDANAGYYGVKSDDTVAAREWRTPPLWGLRDSAPYLHDGRAETVEQAIVAHGGEATRIVEAYRDLADRDRSTLLVFLASLTAPR